MTPSADFTRARSRTLVLWLAGFVVAVLAFNELLRPNPEWLAPLMGGLFYAALFLWVWRECRKAQVSWKRLIGPGFASLRFGQIVLLTFSLLVAGEGCFWVFWMPISYALPDFTVRWGLSPYPPHWDPAFPLPSLATILLSVAVAPVVEELVFRGVLLQRWTAKWGAWPAMIASSLLFGFVHSDTLGAAVFGGVLGFLASRTGSLKIPIAIHTLNNALAFALEFAPDWAALPHDLEAFRNQWPWGLGCLLAGVFLLHRLWPLYRSRRPLTFELGPA